MGRIRDEAPALAIDEQIELLERRLSDRHFVAEHQRLLEGVSSLEFDDRGLRDADGFLPAVSELGHALAARRETET